MPARLFSLYPPVHPTSIVFSRQAPYLFNEPSQPLPERAVVRGLASRLDEKQSPKLTTERLADRLSNLFDLRRQFKSGPDRSGLRNVEHAVGELGKGEELRKTLFGTVKAIGKYPCHLIGRVNVYSGLPKLTIICGKCIDRLGGGIP